MSETTIERGSNDWPRFAPVWAESANHDSDNRTMTFERGWSIPGTFRGMEPLIVVRVLQDFTYDEANEVVSCTEPWVSTDPDGLWADRRRDEITATLRAIADALAPVVGGGEGEPTE